VARPSGAHVISQTPGQPWTLFTRKPGRTRWVFDDSFQIGEKIFTGIEFSVRGTGIPFFIDLAFLGLPLWCPEPRLVGIDGVDLGHGPTVTGQNDDLSIAFDGRDLFRS
jgi:hypothetical protein